MDRSGRRLPPDAGAPVLLKAELLHLHDVAWSGSQLLVHWGVDDRPFTTSLHWSSVDLDELEERIGHEAMAELALHIALFEVDKGTSFGCERVALADPWARRLTPALRDLWQEVVRRVWAQWRYEHDLPAYPGPELPEPAAPDHGPLASVVRGDTHDLWFCGGGKDSLLAGQLLASAGRSYDALVYSHSTYGDAAHQHELIDRVVARSAAGATHRIDLADTAMDAHHPLEVEVLAAETPSSLFAALPVALTHGYGHLLVAHERSANVGNLTWRVTGEDVNHQWGKSLEAERLLDEYVAHRLVAGLRWCSVLQPAYDATIFAALRGVADAIPAAHSCNVAKPWCGQCPKCAYVWICYRAWLPWEPVDAAFGGANLLDDPANLLAYRQMLGLEEHTPFECIGQIDETRLAFLLARARGQTGAALALLDEVGPIDWRAIADRYLEVDGTGHRMPPELAGPIVGELCDAARVGRDRVEALLEGS